MIGVFYTVLGGMKAVVWTDVLQFFMLGGGLIVTVVVLCMSIDGGAVAAVRVALEQGHGTPQFADPEFYSISPYVRLLFFVMLWNAITGPLTNACSDQINIQRLLSTRDWKAGFKAQITSTILGFLSMQMIYFIGFAIFTYYYQNPDPALERLGGNAAFFRFISTKLPTPLPGIFMAAMLAAIMSTLDSGINSMATVWLKEFHVRFINDKLTDAQEVTVSRWATLIIGVFGISLGLAVNFSGRWLSQSVAEVGTIFYVLGAATLPAFLFAVLTPRANSTLIWAYTFFSVGEAIGKNCWYVLSRTAEQAWLRNPTLDFGWAGRLSAVYWIVPLVCGVVSCAPWLVRELRQSRWVKLLALLGMFWFGVAEATGIWYYFSQEIADVPLARSFAFYLPVAFIGAFIILWFCPKQPERKYRGLTLGTLGEPVAVAKK